MSMEHCTDSPKSLTQLANAWHDAHTGNSSGQFQNWGNRQKITCFKSFSFTRSAGEDLNPTTMHMERTLSPNKASVLIVGQE